MTKTTILNTSRLTLETFSLQDTAFIVELLNSPGWLKFIGDRKVKSDDDATRYLLEGPMKSYREHGFGLWKVMHRHDNIPIGMCGLLKRNFLLHPDIGFAFLPAFTKQGYAFEIASATLHHAHTAYHFPTVYAITLPTNVSSIKLIEKLSFQYNAMTTMPNETEPLMLYEHAQDS